MEGLAHYHVKARPVEAGPHLLLRRSALSRQLHECGPAYQGTLIGPHAVFTMSIGIGFIYIGGMPHAGYCLLPLPSLPVHVNNSQNVVRPISSPVSRIMLSYERISRHYCDRLVFVYFLARRRYARARDLSCTLRSWTRGPRHHQLIRPFSLISYDVRHRPVMA